MARRLKMGDADKRELAGAVHTLVGVIRAALSRLNVHEQEIENNLVLADQLAADVFERHAPEDAPLDGQAK